MQELGEVLELGKKQKGNLGIEIEQSLENLVFYKIEDRTFLYTEDSDFYEIDVPNPFLQKGGQGKIYLPKDAASKRVFLYFDFDREKSKWYFTHLQEDIEGIENSKIDIVLDPISSRNANDVLSLYRKKSIDEILREFALHLHILRPKIAVRHIRSLKTKLIILKNCTNEVQAYFLNEYGKLEQYAELKVTLEQTIEQNNEAYNEYLDN